MFTVIRYPIATLFPLVLLAQDIPAIPVVVARADAAPGKVAEFTGEADGAAAVMRRALEQSAVGESKNFANSDRYARHPRVED